MELTRNSRTGGHDLWKIKEALEARGVQCTLEINARSEGYGVADVLTIPEQGGLSDSEWRLLARGYTPDPPSA